MKIKTLFIVITAIVFYTGVFMVLGKCAAAADTPKQQFILPPLFSNHFAVLEIFPLNRATITDVTIAYGDPQMRIDGAGKDKEIWTYYKASTVYTFYFLHGKVYDINKSITGPLWSGNMLNARELQGVGE